MWEQLWEWLSEPGHQIAFLGIIIAFIVGTMLGRLARHRAEKKVKAAAERSDEAFFKGIQYILSNDHDHAIEEFTKSVQLNSETIETYVALGNLYRTKGEIDRAIRIRQSIIHRPSISKEIRIRALVDLGLDYRKGGFLNRALKVFLDVLMKQPTDLQTLEEVEKIYEEMKDWENAFDIRQRLSRLVKGEHRHILAHHQTELGKAYYDKGEVGKAKSCYEKAISINKKCVDAYLHLGDLHFDNQQYKKAIAAWKKVVLVKPSFTFLAYRRLEGAYAKMENLQPVEDFLKECAELNSDAFTRLALARHLHNKQEDEDALKELEGALALDPFFWEARKLVGEILLAQDRKADVRAAYQDLISHLNVAYLKFQCTHCGYEPDRLQWQCPQCKRWDTMDFASFEMGHSTSPHHLPNPLFEKSETEVEEKV
jgi:lipopolysaccharide biosynthesis regulator YciM